MNILFLGDSITDCSHSFDPENLGYGYVRMIAEALAAAPLASLLPPAAPDTASAPRTSMESSVEPVRILNKGIDGFTLPRVYDLWQRMPDCRAFPGKSSFDLVSLLVGINDVGSWMDCGRSPKELTHAVLEFAQTYEDLVCDILDQGIPRVLIMEPFLFPVPAKYRVWQPCLTALSEEIRSIARRHSVLFLPLQQRLHEAGEKNGYGAITLDGIHLTEQGNRLLADAWLECVSRQ